MKVLFIDTETTGLPVDITQGYLAPGNFPRMVQLAYKLYKWTDNDRILLTLENTYVIPTFEIPKLAVKIHGITTKKATKRGKELSECLMPLSKALKEADRIVAHSAEFDGGVIGQEFFICFEMDVMASHWYKLFCTKKHGRDICKIPLNDLNYKFPSLQELHKFFYGRRYWGSHDAQNDVNALIRCYHLFDNV
ncbi:3'-5' exonuclease [Emticicia sp. BO119]|uniref:3'-5' exonuclease n=1 Tax=Emticicia sp. BO119 TaxID=2757768 RepID=UPI0015F11D3E|nr:3'-5' exonuclease [Emticicia sp. BO119]MBA4848995.1 3'-5' exonuclease [Emticicia sp. BO119]